MPAASNTPVRAPLSGVEALVARRGGGGQGAIADFGGMNPEATLRYQVYRWVVSGRRGGLASSQMCAGVVLACAWVVQPPRSPPGRQHAVCVA